MHDFGPAFERLDALMSIEAEKENIETPRMQFSPLARCSGNTLVDIMAREWQDYWQRSAETLYTD